MNSTIYKKLLLTFLSASFMLLNFAQDVENDFQTRAKVKLGFNPVSKVKVFIIPQFRLDETFNIDKYLADAEVIYKPISLFSIGGSYRIIGESNSEGKDELLNRFALNASLQKIFKRWEPSIRTKYTNYTEDLNGGEFLRLRGKVEYNIRKSKITPSISTEAYNDLNNNGWYKLRYGIGINYKINKNQSFFTGYRFDYYLKQYRNKHILNLGYKINF